MEEEEELRAGEKLLREQCKCDGAGHFFRTRVIHGLQIREIPWDLAGDVGTGGVVWRAADVLISHLPAADEIAGKRVLELGSGCGLPGLVLACRGADCGAFSWIGMQSKTQINSVHSISSSGAIWSTEIVAPCLLPSYPR
eukprot:GEMP01082581.1.p1 GENE.GEMP01082581.1~~GEMP01082581.1.p1  ORF type:complete len:140 (+),score=31.50 GEMP01082581.1:100-519(+)